MTTSRRRRFTARVVLEALRGDRSVQEIAARHPSEPGERLDAAGGRRVGRDLRRRQGGSFLQSDQEADDPPPASGGGGPRRRRLRGGNAMTDKTHSTEQSDGTEIAAQRDNFLKLMVELEGDYGNHANDPGGPTRWGITEEVAKKCGYTGDMKDLPKSTAVEIYREHYWDRRRLDDVLEAGMPRLAWEIFDVAVNMKLGTAEQMWQQALNALNDRGRRYADIKENSTVDDATVEATRMAAEKLEEADAVLAAAVNCLQGARFIHLAREKPEKEAFVRGWLLKRVMKTWASEVPAEKA